MRLNKLKIETNKLLVSRKPKSFDVQSYNIMTKRVRDQVSFALNIKLSHLKALKINKITIKNFSKILMSNFR